ncbi:hypothetical protein ABWH91_00545 [Phycisphaerales bacterium ac7]
MEFLSIIVVLFAVYAATGVVIGAAYPLRSAPRRDETLRASALHVRVLLLPGAVAVWPLLLPRLLGRAGAPE